VSIDRTGGSRAHVDDARTDPFLPRITDEMLAARSAPVPVPVLDDRALAEMLAELDGDESAEELDKDVGARPPSCQVPAPRTAEPSRIAPPRTERPRTEPSRTEPPPVQRSRAELDDEPRTFGPDSDPSVLRESADGPVLCSRYGDFRPPVPVGRRRGDPDNDWYLPDAPSLTGLGLTRRSWSRTGSRLFHWLFAALFLLILLQTVVGLITAAATP
jgi:hypothetical protein